MKPYEVFDHTADIGLLIRGNDLSDLLIHSAYALYDVVTDFEDCKNKFLQAPANSCEFEISLKAANYSELLFFWMREILFLFSAKKMIFSEFVFRSLTEQEVRASLHGKYFNPEKHEQRCEVKAVTQHQFEVKKENDGWSAKVILDI